MPEHRATLRRRWGWVTLSGALLALLAVRMWLIAPSPSAIAQDSRALQLWPDRIAGVASGQLVGSAVVTGTEILPVGVCYGPGDVVVRGRTYLHFPLNVFPPGSEIRRATLHLYVNGRSGPGTARLGVYRVLDSWEELRPRSDPATWPALLDSPIGVTRLSFGTPAPTATTSPTPTLTPSPTAVPLTVTVTPSPTPPTGTLAPTPTPSPTPTPRPTVQVSLEKVDGQWLTWDVTVLLRAWLAGETDNEGLAVASAPQPDALPEVAGDLLAAQRLIVGPDEDTRPYLVVEFDVYTPTPTPTAPTSPLPTPTPIVVLPPAGAPVRAGTWGDWLLVGLGVVLVAVAVWREG